MEIEDPGEFETVGELLDWVEEHPEIYEEITVQNPRPAAKRRSRKQQRTRTKKTASGKRRLSSTMRKALR